MNTTARLPLLGSMMLCAFLAGPTVSWAENANVVYINGIQNTLTDAAETRNRIQEVLDNSVNHTGATKRSFYVGLIWNPVGWYGTEDGQWDLEQDLKEMFLLKTAEELFANDFIKILAPFNALAPVIDRTAAQNVAAYLEDMTPGTTSLEAGDDPMTDVHMLRTKTAAEALVARVKRKTPVVVVAHSQGNLLANLAYASLASEYGDDLFKILRVVNVANTTQFAVSNLNFTHAGDAALFLDAKGFGLQDQSLETLPVRKNWTRWSEPVCDVCNFGIIDATFNAQNDIDGQDSVDRILDHSITQTYLSDAEVTVKANAPIGIFTPDANRFVDRFEDFVYAAANSLINSTNTCRLGEAFSNVVVAPINQAVTFDGTGFDATRTADAAWVEVAGVEYLFYAGVPFGNTQDLGLAKSTNSGLTWSKVTDVPLIPRSSAPYWAKQRIVPIRVLHEDGLFKLWYWGNNTNLFTDAGNIHGFGYATSADGLSWTTTEAPIRVESGSGEGARLLEVVKAGTRYRAYYEDSSKGQAPVTYVADSADGVTFVGPDQRVPFGDEYLLMAATSLPGDGCFLGIWQRRDTGSYVATTSVDGVNFNIVSAIDLPDGFTPNDISIDGLDVVFYGSKYEGNVNWSYGNISLAIGRELFFLMPVPD